MLGSNIHPKNLCFGRVVSVDSTTRLYTVQYWTAEGKQGKRSGVQALSSVASLEGDENSCLAEADSLCLVGFVGDQPFIIGFFIPKQTNKPKASETKNIDTGQGNEGATVGSAAGNRGSADTGDQVYGTRGRNKIVLRRSGIIEIEASKTCYRTMIPATSTIIDQCSTYNFNSDGVILTTRNLLKNGKSSDDTYFGVIFRDKSSASNLVTLERGTVSDSDSELIEKYAVGTAKTKIPSILVTKYVRFQKNTGAFQEAVNPGGGDPKPDQAAYYRGVDPDGNYEETINSKTYSLTITSDGNINRETAGDLTDTIKGKTSLTYEKDFEHIFKGKSSVTYEGDAEVSYQKSYKVAGKQESIEMENGKIAITGASGELVDFVYQICDALSQSLTPGYNGPLSNMATFAKLALSIQGMKK